MSAEERVQPSPRPAPSSDLVLARYFEGDHLFVMPRAGRKRRIVLEHLATWFEPGVRYSEVEANRVLRPAHNDVAMLRRYLVDEGLLSREHGEYWRSSGPVEVG